MEAIRNGGPLKVDLQDFAVNLGAGRVTDLWCPESAAPDSDQKTSTRKIVVNIQDLHCNPDVQHNIAKILQDLDEKYGVATVYVEGGHGDIDTSWLCDIQDKHRKNTIIESMLSAGKLTGSEYYSVISGKPHVLKGLENEQAHKENIARLSRLMDRKDYFSGKLALLDKDLETMQLRHFTLRNKRFCRLIEKHRQGKVDSEKYYQLLAKYIAKINTDKDDFNTLYSISIDNYPNIKTYLELSALGKHIRHKKAANDLRGFLQQLKERIPYSLYTQLLKKTDNFQRMNELAVYLAELSSRFNFPLETRYPELALFFKYSEKSRQLNALQLLAEEKKLVREIRIGFSENKSELDVSFLTDFYSCFKDYLHTEISADDYHYFVTKYAAFQDTWAKYAFVNRMSALSGDLALLDAYYKTNCIRNDYFLQNIGTVADTQAPEQEKEFLTLENMHQKNIPALLRDSGFVVLVTGGFHSEGLKALFKDRRIPYMTITPNVASGTDFSNMTYRNVIQEQAKLLTNALGPELLAQAAVVYRYKIALETLKGAEQQTMFKILERATGISLTNYNEASRIAVLSNGARLTLSKNTGNVKRIDNISDLTAALDAALKTLSAIERTAQAAIFGDILDLFIVASETAVRNGYMTGDGPSYSVANDPQLNNERYIAGIPAEIFDNFSPKLQDAIRERTKRIQSLQKTTKQQPLVEAALATELLRHLLASLQPAETPQRQEQRTLRGGRWPFLKKVYDRTEALTGKLLGSKAGWLLGQVILPVLIESVTAIGGISGLTSFGAAALFGIPVITGPPLILMIAGLQLAWHVLHAIPANAGRLSAGELLPGIYDNLKSSAFSPDKLLISAATLLVFAVFPIIDPSSILGALSFAAGISLPHLLVNYLTVERPETAAALLPSAASGERTARRAEEEQATLQQKMRLKFVDDTIADPEVKRFLKEIILSRKFNDGEIDKLLVIALNDEEKLINPRYIRLILELQDVAGMGNFLHDLDILNRTKFIQKMFELDVARHLQQQGYDIVELSFKGTAVEADIIVREKGRLQRVEVQLGLGHAASSPEDRQKWMEEQLKEHKGIALSIADDGSIRTSEARESDSPAIFAFHRKLGEIEGELKNPDQENDYHRIIFAGSADFANTIDGKQHLTNFVEEENAINKRARENRERIDALNREIDTAVKALINGLAERYGTRAVMVEDLYSLLKDETAVERILRNSEAIAFMEDAWAQMAAGEGKKLKGSRLINARKNIAERTAARFQKEPLPAPERYPAGSDIEEISRVPQKKNMPSWIQSILRSIWRPAEQTVEETRAGLIGKYVVLGTPEFVRTGQGNKGVVRARVRSISTGLELDIEIDAEIKPGGGLRTRLAALRNTTITDPAALKMIDGFILGPQKDYIVLEDNPYNIYGMGGVKVNGAVEPTMAIADFLEDNDIALFHEIAEMYLAENGLDDVLIPDDIKGFLAEWIKENEQGIPLSEDDLVINSKLFNDLKTYLGNSESYRNELPSYLAQYEDQDLAEYLYVNDHYLSRIEVWIRYSRLDAADKLLLSHMFLRGAGENTQIEYMFHDSRFYRAGKLEKLLIDINRYIFDRSEDELKRKIFGFQDKVFGERQNSRLTGIIQARNIGKRVKGALGSVKGLSAAVEQKWYVYDRAIRDKLINKIKTEMTVIEDGDPEFVSLKNEMDGVFREILEATEALLKESGNAELAEGLSKDTQFLVVDSKDANAFTYAYFGIVVVTTGLLKEILGNEINNKGTVSKDAVAFVLAHEIAHILQAREELKNNKVIYGDHLFDMKVKNYAKEKDADLRALKILNRAGFSMPAANDFFEAVEKKRRGHIKILSFLDEHAELPERIAYIKHALRSSNWIKNTKADATAFSGDAIEELKTGKSVFKNIQDELVVLEDIEAIKAHITSARTLNELEFLLLKGYRMEGGDILWRDVQKRIRELQGISPFHKDISLAVSSNALFRGQAGIFLADVDEILIEKSFMAVFEGKSLEELIVLLSDTEYPYTWELESNHPFAEKLKELSKAKKRILNLYIETLTRSIIAEAANRPLEDKIALLRVYASKSREFAQETTIPINEVLHLAMSDMQGRHKRNAFVKILVDMKELHREPMAVSFILESYIENPENEDILEAIRSSSQLRATMIEQYAAKYRLSRDKSIDVAEKELEKDLLLLQPGEEKYQEILDSPNFRFNSNIDMTGKLRLLRLFIRVNDKNRSRDGRVKQLSRTVLSKNMRDLLTDKKILDDAYALNYIRATVNDALKKTGIDADSTVIDTRIVLLMFLFDSGALLEPKEFIEVIYTYLSNGTVPDNDLIALAKFLNSSYLRQKQREAGIPTRFDAASFREEMRLASTSLDETIVREDFYTPKTWAEYISFANTMIYFKITGQEENLRHLGAMEEDNNPLEMFLGSFSKQSTKLQISRKHMGLILPRQEILHYFQLIRSFESKIGEILLRFPKYFDRRVFSREDLQEKRIFDHILRSQKSFDELFTEGLTFLPESVFRDYWLLYLLAKGVRDIDPSFIIDRNVQLKDIQKLLRKREKQGKDNAEIYGLILKVAGNFSRDTRMDDINTGLLSFWKDMKNGERKRGIGKMKTGEEQRRELWMALRSNMLVTGASRDELEKLHALALAGIKRKPRLTLIGKFKQRISALITTVKIYGPLLIKQMLATAPVVEKLIQYLRLNREYNKIREGTAEEKGLYLEAIAGFIGDRYDSNANFPPDVTYAKVLLDNYFREQILAGIYKNRHFSSVLRWSLIYAAQLYNRGNKIDVFYFDFQGKLVHPDTAVPDLAERALIDIITNRTFSAGYKAARITALFPTATPLRDKYLEMLAEQELKKSDLRQTGENLDRLLPLFANAYLRDRYAMAAFQIARRTDPGLQWNWKENRQYLKENNFAAIRAKHLEFIKRNVDLAEKYFDAGYLRDDLLLAIVEEAMTDEEYGYIEKKLYKYANNFLKDSEMGKKLFIEDKLAIFMDDLDAKTRSEVVLWMLGAGKKPLALVEIEESFGINLDRLKDSYGGKFEQLFPVDGDALDLSRVGATPKKEFIRRMFTGEKGILSDDRVFNEFMEQVFLKVAPGNRKTRANVKKVMDSILSKSTPDRKLEIVQSLAVVMGDALDGDRRMSEAETIARFFESLGLIGVKAAQVLAHSYDIDLPRDIREALLSLSSTAEPLNKQVVFETIRSVYGQDGFDKHFEYIGRRLGSASIKVVYAARAKDADDEHVFKIKRPDVAQKSKEDLQTLTAVLEDLRSKGFAIPAGLENRISGAIDEDADFDNEKRNTEIFAEQLARQKDYRLKNGDQVRLTVANILNVENNVIMETEFADGVSLDREQEIIEQNILTKEELNEVKQILFDFLMWQVFDEQFYLADPHGGNFFISRDADGTVQITLIDNGSAENPKAKGTDPLKMFEAIVNLSVNRQYKPDPEYLYFSVFFAKTGYLRNALKRGVFGIERIREIGRTIWKYQQAAPLKTGGTPYKNSDRYLSGLIFKGLTNRTVSMARSVAARAEALLPDLAARAAIATTVTVSRLRRTRKIDTYASRMDTAVASFESDELPQALAISIQNIWLTQNQNLKPPTISQETYAKVRNWGWPFSKLSDRAIQVLFAGLLELRHTGNYRLWDKFIARHDVDEKGEKQLKIGLQALAAVSLVLAGLVGYAAFGMADQFIVSVIFALVGGATGFVTGQIAGHSVYNLIAPWINWAVMTLGNTDREKIVHHLIDYRSLEDAVQNLRGDTKVKNIVITMIPYGHEFPGTQPGNTGVTFTVNNRTLRLFSEERQGIGIYYLQPSASYGSITGALNDETAARVITYLNGNDRLNGKMQDRERSGTIMIVDHVGVEMLREKLSADWMNNIEIIKRSEFPAEEAGYDFRGEFEKRRIIRNAGMTAVGRNNILKLDIRSIRELPDALKLYNNIHNGQFMLDKDLLKDAVKNTKTEKLLTEIIAGAHGQGNYVYGRHAIDGSAGNGKAMAQIRQLFKMGFSGLALDLSNMDGTSAAVLLEQLEGYSILAVTMPGGEIRENSIIPVNDVGALKNLPTDKVLEVTFPLNMTTEQLRTFSEALARTPNPKIFSDRNIQQLIAGNVDFNDKVGLTSLLDFIASVGAEKIQTPRQALSLGYSWDAADLPPLSKEQIRRMANGDLTGITLTPALLRKYASLHEDDLHLPFLQGVAGKMLIMMELEEFPELAADYGSGRYGFRDHVWEELLGMALTRRLEISSTESEVIPEHETMHSFIARKSASLRAGSKEPKEINVVAEILLQDLVSNYNLKKNAGKKQGTVDIKLVEKILSAA